jgi:hypothetical protein
MTLPQHRFTKDATHDELLSLMIILYSIALSQDVVELNRFVVVTSKIIGPEDFNKLLRRVMRMMGTNKCGGDTSCSDWLMTKLYELYEALGTDPETKWM